MAKAGLFNGRAPSANRFLKRSLAAPENFRDKWLVSLAVVFGALMSAIDMSVVNVALPTIEGNVGATQQEITWVATGYLTSLVILMPLTNWLSVRFGRKRIYLISLVLFTVASFLCGTARTLGTLVFWRVVQGLGAGTLQPLAQAIFREAFPPREQGLAMSLFGLVVMSGPAIGPTLGGWITDNYSWPWIFFVNVPVGIVGYLVGVRMLKDPPHMKGGVRETIDGAGIFFMAIGLASLQIVLEEGETLDWFSSPFIVFCTVTSVVGLVAFVWRELTFAKPAVDLRIMRNLPFTAGSIMSAIQGLGLFAGLFLLPQYMQITLGYSATNAGLALMPRSLLMMALLPVAGLLFNRLGPRVLIASGLVIIAYSQWLMSQFTLQTSSEQILFPQLIQGAGFAVMFVSLSTTALSWIDRKHLTSATGLFNLIRQIGGSLGTALVVTVVDRRTDLARTDLVSVASPHNPAFAERMAAMTANLVAHGYGPDMARRGALALMDRLIQVQATMVGYDYVFFGIGALFALLLPLVYWLDVPCSVRLKGAPN